MQAISNTLEGDISTNVPKLHEVPDLAVQNHAVSVFNQVLLATMAKAQTKDSVLGLVIQYVWKGKKPKGLAILKLDVKQCESDCCSLNRLVMKHVCYIKYTLPMM